MNKNSCNWHFSLKFIPSLVLLTKFLLKKNGIHSIKVSSFNEIRINWHLNKKKKLAKTSKKNEWANTQKIHPFFDLFDRLSVWCNFKRKPVWFVRLHLFASDMIVKRVMIIIFKSKYIIRQRKNGSSKQIPLTHSNCYFSVIFSYTIFQPFRRCAGFRMIFIFSIENFSHTKSWFIFITSICRNCDSSTILCKWSRIKYLLYWFESIFDGVKNWNVHFFVSKCTLSIVIEILNAR